MTWHPGGRAEREAARANVPAVILSAVKVFGQAYELVEHVQDGPGRPVTTVSLFIDPHCIGFAGGLPHTAHAARCQCTRQGDL